MSVENISISSTKIFSEQEFASLSNFEQLRYFIQWATLAPNTHNVQPWAFFISEKSYQITVYLDRSRVLPASDKDGRQSVISIGCALENILVAAAAYGKKCSLHILENEKDKYTPTSLEDTLRYTPIAELTFEASIPTDNQLLKAISNRKVMRAEYDREKIIDETILQKIQEAGKHPGIELHLIGDPIRRQAMAEFQGQADSYVINSKKFSRELGDWLLPNESTSSLGMPGIGFGLQNDEALRLHRALRGEESLQPEDGLKFALAGKIAMEKSPFIGFLTAEKDDPQHWIAAGQALEHIFLTCTQFEICTAVHAGIVEVALVNRIFAATLGTSKRITAVFRMGYIKNPKDLQRPHPPRLPVDEVLLPSKI